MPFGNKADPTIVYKYGAWEPVAGLDVVDEQMAAAQRYRNALTEIELRRRERAQQAICQLSPELEELQAERKALSVKIEEVRASIKSIRQTSRKRSAVPPELRDRLNEAKAASKALTPRLREARSAAYSTDEAKAAMAEINLRANEEQKAARKTSGLYWGTYLQIEKAADQARKSRTPPRFRRWTGDGMVAVQLQKGLPTSALFVGNDRRVQIKRGSARKPSPYRNNHKEVTLRLRVASNGKDPVWAVVPLSLDRPLPQDAMVTWVCLVRRKIGLRTKWHVTFSLTRPAGWKKVDTAQSGSVAFDVGWRLMHNRLRVARWHSDDGDCGEVSIPLERAEYWKQPDELRSVRDLNFNEARDALAVFLQGPTSTPDWLLERTQRMRSWKRQGRLAVVLIHWRNQRFDGDAEIFERLEAWRKQDKHLCNWESGARHKLQEWRKHLYRNAAARLSRRYKTAYIEDTNWSDLATRPRPEDENTGSNRYWMRVASPGLFLECIKQRFAEVVEVPAENTTKMCYACGDLVEFDARTRIWATCKCGARWDQDENAAKNILARGLAASETPSALAQEQATV